MIKRNLLAACAASALAFGFAVPASAQDTRPTAQGDADPAPNTQEGDSGDIIVTAQGRAQRLADVPISVSAVSAEALENTGANDIRQLTQIAPSLQVSSTGTESNGSARIRGIGTVGDNPGLESSVAVFIDGVYRSRSGIGLSELGEIDQIEVLRGPQGTLFGRNASAGLINISSKAPSFTFGANGEISYGNYDYIRGQIGVTGPISDQIAARIDAVYVKRDGFYSDPNNDTRINDRDRYFVKGQLLFEPSTDLSVRLIGDYTRRTESCCGAAFLDSTVAPANALLTDPSINPAVQTDIALGTPAAAFSNPYSRTIYTTPGRTYQGRTTDWGVSAQADLDLGGAMLTSITAYRYYKAEGGSDTDYSPIDILYSPDDGNNFRKFKTFTQELRLQGSAFDDHLDWLIGGYFANEELNTGTNVTFGNDFGRYVSCRLFNGGGLDALVDFTKPTCLSAQGEGTVAALFGADTLKAVQLLSQASNTSSPADRYHQNSRNFAAFTHNIVHLTPGLDFTVGLRYTDERKKFDASFTGNNTLCPQIEAIAVSTPNSITGGALALGCVFNSSSALNGVSIDDERRESEFTGTAVLSYKPTDRSLVYASYSRGYKAGGFNLDRSALKPATVPLAAYGATPQAAADALVGNLQFDPETVNAYEIGAKYSTRAFSLSVSAFRQEFSSFQLNTFNGLFFIVQNVNGCSGDLTGGPGGDSDTSAATGACDKDDVSYGVRSQGVELEASINPSRDLAIGAGFTYAKTEYRDDLVGNKSGAPLDPALRKLPGDDLSNAPEIVVTTSVAWTPPLGNTGLTGLIYFDQRTSSDYNTGSDLFPQKEQDSFTVVNGRIGIHGADDRWGIELFAQNLLNTNYAQVAFNSPFQASSNFAPAVANPSRYPGGGQIFSAFLAEPRTYGITLRGRF